MQWRDVLKFVVGWLTVLIVSVALASPQDSSTIRLESNLVTIDLSVTDGEGNYVTDLQKKDFTVFHDGIPQPISFFDAVQDRRLTRPLAVVFALDVSGSLGVQVVQQQAAARRFISLLQKPSLFSVIGFNDRVHVYQKFTDNPRKVLRGFKKAKKIGGRTRLYDAIDRAVTMLVRNAPSRRQGRHLRRVVVVITDGIDYTSMINHQELIRRANNAGVTVYSITLPSYIMSVRGRQRVPTLLDASGVVRRTGGIDFSAEERDFAKVFRNIAEEIQAGYVLAYYPPKKDLRDGRSHKIKVVAHRAGVRIRQNRAAYTAASH